MKQADIIRMSLAYVLIATSGRAHGGVTDGTGERPKERAREPSAARASSPIAVPARGWFDIARSVWTKIGKNRVVAVAAGLTFYGLLAIFPTVTALVSVYGLFADPASINAQLQHLAGIVPEGAISIIGDQVQRISSKGASTLGFAFLTGLLVALWSANSGVKALFDALNVAYEAEETRGFFRLNAISLVFTISGVLLAVLGLSLTVIIPWVLNHFFLSLAFVGTIVRWLSIPLTIVVALFMLAMLYRFGPSTMKPSWRWVTPGSLFAAAFLIIASGAFAFYVAHFGSYNKTYGSLGAVIGFMTWLWISFIVVMVGAEINSEVEREAKGDTPAADKSSPRTN
jgi:membrane protein